MRSTGRLTNAIRARKKAVTYFGTAAALAGVGIAGAASLAAAGNSHPVAAINHLPWHRLVTPEQAGQKAVAHTPSAAHHAVTNSAHAEPVKVAKSAAPTHKGAKAGTAAKAAHVKAVPVNAAPAKSATTAKAAPAKSVTPTKAAPAKSAAPAKAAPAKTTPAKSAAPAKAAPATSASPVTPAPVKTAPAPAAAPAPQAPSWSQIQQQVAKQTSPSEPRAADQLQPTGTAGPQAWMPISPDQQANATTIVQQALDKGMGVRSAVIAVATAMQESQLQNINYGTSDSLGLFQQRPSMGWGTAQQITTPKYAADAFLTALQQQQAGNPGWAQQPLWSTAQAVQKSGFPFAYAKWETQAVQLVKNIVTQVK